MLNSVALVAGLGAILGTGCIFLHRSIGSTQAAAAAATFGMSLPNFAVCVVSLLCFFILSERFFSEIFPSAKTRRMVIGVTSLLFLGIATFFSLVPYCIILTVNLCIAYFDSKRHINEEKELLTFKRLSIVKNRQTTKYNIKLNNKPNIYLFLLESYNSVKTIKKIYNYDDSKTDVIFEKYGLKNYYDTYSNAASTARSVANLFTWHLFEGSSEVPTLDILRKNGYKCEFFDTAYFVFGEYVDKNEFASFGIDDRVISIYDFACPLFSQSRFLRHAINGVDPFEIDINFTELFDIFKKRVHTRSNTPRFFVSRFGACHTPKGPWMEDASEFSTRYVNMIKEGSEQIEKMLDFITTTDPGALIIAVGDHGGLRHRNVFLGKGKDAQQVMAERGVTIEDLALDHFGIRLAIRWPTPHSTDGKVISHVNLFRYVLEALSYDRTLLSTLQPNISLLEKKKILVKEGEILPNFETYTPESFIGPALERYNDGKATEEDCVSLMNAYYKSDKELFIEISKYAKSKFSRSQNILNALGKIYCSQIRKKGLEYYQKSLHVAPNNRDTLLIYCQELLKFGHYEKAIYHSTTEILQDIPIASLIKLESEAALKMHKAADTTITRMLEKFNTNMPLHSAAIAYYLQKEDIDKANHIAKISKTIKAKLADKEIHDILRAAVLFRMNKFEAAETVLKKQLGKSKLETWKFFLLSYAQEVQGKIDESLQTLRDAVPYTINNPITNMARIGHLAKRHGLDFQNVGPCLAAAENELQSFTTLVRSSGIVDEDRYRDRWQKADDPTPPAQHYLTTGIHQGADLVPWGHSLAGIAFNSKVRRTGLTPFGVFLETPCKPIKYFPGLGNSPLTILAKDKTLRTNKEFFLQTANQAWR